MLFQTPTQFVVLVLCLLAGWLLGLASSSGGRKWKERFRALEAEHGRYRTEAERAAREKDAHIREIEADRDRRIATVENEHRRTATTGTVTTTRADASRDLGGSWRDWFGRARDNLSRIEGIDETLERKLNVLGIKSFRDIETLTDDDEAALEDELHLARGTVSRQDWRGQARGLREGVDEMDRRRV